MGSVVLTKRSPIITNPRVVSEGIANRLYTMDGIDDWSSG